METKNIIKDYEPDITNIRVNKIARYFYPKPMIGGWIGSATINDSIYTGEFGKVEDYPIWDGNTNEMGEPINHFIIDWSEYIPELKQAILENQ